MLHIALLGQPQIRLNGVPLHFSTAKAQTLLCYLVAVDKPHSRTSLAGLLWGELPEASARRNLRVELSRLRTQLADYLAVTRTTIAFNRQQPHWLDIDQFRPLNQHLEAINRATLEQTIALYRGPFLEDVSVRDAPEFELWVLQERERLAQHIIASLKWLIRTFEQESDYQKALAYGNRWLSIERWNEEAHLLVMRLLFQMGQRGAALAQFEQCKQLLAETMGVEPSPEITTLNQQIQANEPIGAQVGPHSTMATPFARQSLNPPINNQPRSPNPFVGRHQELDQIITLLKQRSHRLITIAGLGGIGKTRLALELMPHLNSYFPDGVFFVPLAPLSAPQRLATTIATNLALNLNGVTAPQAQLLNYLRNKQLLLILDNFEHLLTGTDLLLEILEQTTAVKIIVTSRVALGVAEEALITLNGLSLPASVAATPLSSEASRLFVERAKQVHLQFDAEQEVADIQQICHLVEGLPLGIELAAVWVRVLSCADIIKEIKHNLNFLKTELTVVPAHQHSLKAVFNYSWSLLPEAAQLVFMQLTIFQGGFRREAAEAVAGASLRILSTLIDRSFLQRLPNGRYQTHELVRHFAAEKLNKQDHATVAQAHSHYFANFVQSLESHLMCEGEGQALAEVAADIENIRLSWLWATQHYQTKNLLACAKILTQYFVRKGLYQEGYQLFSETLATLDEATPQAPEQALSRACLVVNQAIIGFQLSLFDQVKSRLNEALPLLEQAEDQSYLAQALVWLGYAETRTAHYQQADSHLRVGLNIYQDLKDNRGIATALTGLALLANSQDDYVEAEELCLTVLAIYQDEGYPRGLANLLSNLGTTYARRNKINQAQHYYEQALDIAKQVNEPQTIAVLLSNLGSCARAKTDFKLALTYLQESLTLFQQIGDRRWIVATRNLIGLTLLSANRPAEAKTSLIPALQEAMEIQAISDALDCLPLLCRLLLADNHPEATMLVASFAARHAVIRDMARAYALEVQEQAEGMLPAKTVARLQAEAKDKTLAEIADLIFEVFPRL